MNYITVVAILDRRQYLPEFVSSLILSHPAVPGNIIWNRNERLEGALPVQGWDVPCCASMIPALRRCLLPKTDARNDVRASRFGFWCRRRDQPNKHTFVHSEFISYRKFHPGLHIRTPDKSYFLFPSPRNRT